MCWLKFPDGPSSWIPFAGWLMKKICALQTYGNIPNQMISSKSVWLIEYTQTNHVHLCNITKTPFPSSKKPPDSKTWLHNRGSRWNRKETQSFILKFFMRFILEMHYVKCPWADRHIFQIPICFLFFFFQSVFLKKIFYGFSKIIYCFLSPLLFSSSLQMMRPTAEAEGWLRSAGLFAPSRKWDASCF